MKPMVPSAGVIAWSVKRTFVRLRWPGLAGIALLVAALLVQCFVIPATRARVDALRSEARQLSARAGSEARVQAPPTQRGQLSNFYAFFPSFDRLPAVLGDVQLAAEHNGLNLEKGEYRLLRDAQFPLSRYQITLPVAGSYAQVRGFVNEVLDRVPSAALEDLAMKRESIGVPRLEGRVRFVLFVAGQ